VNGAKTDAQYRTKGVNLDYPYLFPKSLPRDFQDF